MPLCEIIEPTSPLYQAMPFRCGSKNRDQSDLCREREAHNQTKRERDEAREITQELLDALSKLVALNTEMTSDDCTYDRAYYCYYKGHYDKWKLATETIAKVKGEVK